MDTGREAPTLISIDPTVPEPDLAREVHIPVAHYARPLLQRAEAALQRSIRRSFDGDYRATLQRGTHAYHELRGDKSSIRTIDPSTAAAPHRPPRLRPHTPTRTKLIEYLTFWSYADSQIPKR